MIDLRRFWKRLIRMAVKRQQLSRQKSRLFDRGPNEINVLVIERAQHRYVFIFDDEHATDVMRTAGRFATDDRLNFNWTDANRVAKCLEKIF